MLRRKRPVRAKVRGGIPTARRFLPDHDARGRALVHTLGGPNIQWLLWIFPAQGRPRTGRRASGVVPRLEHQAPHSLRARRVLSANRFTTDYVNRIAGNPGILTFYDPFFESLHDELSRKVSILAHAHLGHTPNGPKSTTIGLMEQLDALLQVVDACTAHGFEHITVIGHSVGAWLAVQTMKQRLSAVQRVFLLFPTISQIASTPNGRRLSLFFREPLPRVIATLSLLLYPMPRSFYSLLFSSWPPNQISVLQALLGDRDVIYSALTMAHSEMGIIRDIDAPFLTEHTDRVWVYFAQQDDWVGRERETVIRTLGESPRIEHCKLKMPHAFCLNHGEPMAERCALWYLECEGGSLS